MSPLGDVPGRRGPGSPDAVGVVHPKSGTRRLARAPPRCARSSTELSKARRGRGPTAADHDADDRPPDPTASTPARPGPGLEVLGLAEPAGPWTAPRRAPPASTWQASRVARRWPPRCVRPPNTLPAARQPGRRPGPPGRPPTAPADGRGPSRHHAERGGPDQQDAASPRPAGSRPRPPVVARSRRRLLGGATASASSRPGRASNSPPGPATVTRPVTTTWPPDAATLRSPAGATSGSSATASASASPRARAGRTPRAASTART